MKYDDIIAHLGTFGLYQKRLYYLVCLVTIPAAFQSFVPVFFLAIPAYRCAIPSLPNDTYSVQGTWHADLINRTIPTTVDGLSTCTMYNDNYTDIISCNKWVYDQSEYLSTVSTDMNFVCGKEIYRSHANMITFGGYLLGAIVLGFLSDIIGRKKTLMISILMLTLSGIATSFTNSFISYSCVRFINGAAGSGVFVTAFVIGVELVGPSKRTFTGVIIMVFWSIGLLILGCLAYFIRHWQDLSLAISVPCVLLISYQWLLSESPRWLISKGRFMEAETILRKAAKVNKVKLPARLFSRLSLESDVQTAKLGQLVSEPIVVVGTLIVFLNWIVVSMAYYGLALNVTNLSGNTYFNFTIASVAELVSYILCLLLLDRLGRKFLHCSAMLLGGIACLGTMFPVIYGDESHQWINIVLSMVGRLGAAGAFSVIYVFSAELFPTVFRNSLLGTSSTCAQIGAMISPYIADIGLLVGGELKTALPLIIFGSTTVVAALLSLYLPETLNQKLPETIEDAKQLYRNKGKKSIENNLPEKTPLQSAEDLTI